MRLEIKAAARRDLEDIRDFSASAFGTDIALRYLGDVRAAFEHIRAYPGAGAESPNLTPPIRVFLCRSHRIYYRMGDQVVTIVRILHKARDVRRLL